MLTFLKILLIVLSVLLILVILLQNKGVGLSATFGGEGDVYRTRRGADRILHFMTIIIAVLWALTALMIPLLPRIF